MKINYFLMILSLLVISSCVSNSHGVEYTMEPASLEGLKVKEVLAADSEELYARAEAVREGVRKRLKSNKLLDPDNGGVILKCSLLSYTPGVFVDRLLTGFVNDDGAARAESGCDMVSVSTGEKLAYISAKSKVHDGGGFTLFAGYQVLKANAKDIVGAY